MALTGHLSDLSLSELIEFFCNQRKSGRLKVLYAQGPGYFYLQGGSVVDARIGAARGIDAVYYALTLPNAKFEFSAAAESSERSINQPWTQVVLEGLRRLDEGITPADAFPHDYKPEKDELELSDASETLASSSPSGFLSFMGTESKRKPMFAGAVLVAVVGSVAAIGVPAGWYSRKEISAAVVSNPAPSTESSQPSSTSTPEVANSDGANSVARDDIANAAARRQHERERNKAREERAATANTPITAPVPIANGGSKKVAVTVTYDETGRVTQASGGDPSAIRIARQKRFPPGKAGSATVTIPIN